MLDCAQTAALLQGWDKILVMSHASPDGDTLGSASALLRGLSSLGKQVDFLCADPVPEKFSYLFAGLPLGGFEPAQWSWLWTTTAPMCPLRPSAGWSRKPPPPRR